MKFLKNKRKLLITLSSIFLVLAVIISMCAFYLMDYYHTDTKAVEAFAPINAVEMKKIDNTYVFESENPEYGFVFYPGGKVECSAYFPLMQSLSSQGVMCVLIEMPFNLAVFDINAANGITEQYPQIENWYIGGHSLGGSMAASHISENSLSYNGLVLMGSYSTADLSDTKLKVLSIYGSEDMVIDMEKYKKYITNLPDNFSEFIIDGGNHAFFGMYGSQQGDGTPKITNEEQIRITSEEILRFIKDI